MSEKKTPVNGEDQNKYETMIIFHPETGIPGIEKGIKELKDLIGESGGNVWNEDDWGVRELCYKIKNQTKGYYYVMNFNLLPNKLKKVDKYMKLEKDIIRFMIVTVPDVYEVKSIEEYTKEEEKEKAEEKERKEQKIAEENAKKERAVRKPAPKKKEPKKEVEKEVEAPVEAVKSEEAPVKEEVKKEVKEEVKAEKDKKKELDDLDAKLQSIINDSDIIL